MQAILLLIAIGILAGLFSGMLGLGGAVIIIPALMLFLGYSQQMAQGTTLLMMVLPIGALAAWQYYKVGHADIKSALILAAAFFASSYFGAKFANSMSEDVLKKIFAILLIVIAFKMLFFEKAH